jgi:hypothetical protein
MADIEMLGGSGLSMSKSEEGHVQKGGSEGDIEMYGGSHLEMKHAPEPSEQSGKGMSGIDMIGEQGLIKDKHVTPYGSTYPTDKGEV